LLLCPDRFIWFVCSFLFHRFVCHRDLHSFPTRRSSDLTKIIFAGCCTWKIIVRGICSCAALRRTGWPEMKPVISSQPVRRSAARSEEHTSELQSRENLVCRLLLEKKKKQQNLDNRTPQI